MTASLSGKASKQPVISTVRSPRARPIAHRPQRNGTCRCCSRLATSQTIRQAGFKVAKSTSPFWLVNVIFLPLPVRDSPIERTSLFFPVLEGIFFGRWFSMDRSHILAEQDGV